MEINTLKFGVIGVGNMGSFHADSLYTGKIEGASLKALCDSNAEVNKRLAAKYPDVAVYGDYREMLAKEKLDAVIVAVPHYSHMEIAVAALEAGMNVICEKPESVSVTQARMMNEAAKKSGKLFSLMFNQRTTPIYRKAKELVESGALGRKKRLTWIITNWYRTQAYYNSGSWRATWSGEGGGVLLNQAPHNLDLWQWIFGMPDRLTASCTVAKFHNIEVEDDARIFASYNCGATAEFITSTGEYPGTNRLEMIGDRAKIVIEDGKLRLWRLATPEREFCFSSDKSFAEIPTTYEEFDSCDAPEGHIAVVRNFTAALNGREELLSPGNEGINELTISNAAYLSSWTNKEVSIPFDAAEFDRLLAQRVNASVKRYAVPTADENPGERWKVRW